MPTDEGGQGVRQSRQDDIGIMIEKIRNYLRGYSEDDVKSLREKMSIGPKKPGGLIWLTAGESKALTSGKAG